MNALIKKDFRNNLALIIASVLALTLPYLIAISVWFMTLPHRRGIWGDWMYNASQPSMWITAFLAAVYGGIAFAHERRERSADFLAMMPVTRSRIIISKALTAFTCIGTMCVINGIVICVYSRHGDRFDFLMPMAIAVMVFGVAWMCSTFIESAAIAAGIAIGFTYGSMLVLALIFSWAFNNEHDVIVIAGFTILCGVAGVISFLLGSIYYLRRIKP